MTDRPPRFDRVARSYRFLEYLSFGPMLERCRFHHLPVLASANVTRALVLGDGDGRFLARFLGACPHSAADAVDASPAMLRRLSARAARRGAEHRLATICTDARSFTPSAYGYDLVATHFFLDCLTEAETEALIGRILPHLTPDARWVVSEFQVPSGSRTKAAFARALIAGLYTAFRWLTGLRTRRIPPWRALLERSGFTCAASQSFLGGLLVTDLWRFARATDSPSAGSQQKMPFPIELVAMPASIPGIDPGPEPAPGPPAIPEPKPAPGPPPDPDPEPYPGPIPAPLPVTRAF
ncbi:MAG TPA: class I SAM-dependent methyltransferase [Acidobacteriaceae bacterium]|jgi:SAM-dependent methyltransferase|nr:class I SAM-dependent methyltransferase [Acidobacteriaceae bacterium]